MRATLTALLIAASSPLGAAEVPWSFVWVGVTESGWNIVEGTATGKVDGPEMHFDLTGKNSVKYGVDVVLRGSTIQAGFGAYGDDYFGVTIMTGAYVKNDSPDRRPCGIEVLQLHNQYNSLTIKRTSPTAACKS